MSSRIGKYEIVGQIGEGGFGRVYKAQDTQMLRWVAIKVMSVEQNEAALQRFRNEAIVAGGLNHPNLVTVYELGEYNGRPFIVMEYLEGRDLARLLSGPEPLPLSRKIDILTQTARGLERAHRQQVVHRDVKPANVMLLNDGSVKVMDFGIARLTHESSSRNTATGMVVGSLLWMAPEIFTGGDADILTDIWSFGVMAFELLSGQHPYQAGGTQGSPNTAQLVFQITQQEPPHLSSKVPEIPYDLAEIIFRCMARDRADRYQSLRDVVLDLEPILTQQRRQQATALVAEAEMHAARGETDQAMSLVGQALEADNESAAGRQLRERLQREFRKRSARDRVDALIRQSSEDVAAQRLDEAVQKLQNALELDPESRTARARLDELQGLVSRRKQVDQIAARAGAELKSGNLEGTGRLLEEAFALDPNNSQLIQLQQLLVAERLRREKRQRLQAGITQAKEKLEQRKPDEALRILEQAQATIGSDPGFESSLFEIEELRRESDHQETLRQTLAAAKTLERKRDWESVISKLEPVVAGASERWPEMPALLSKAQKELAQHRKAQQIEQAIQTAKDQVGKGDLNGAIATVEHACAAHPGDARLTELSQRLSKEKQRREAEAETTRIQSETRELLRKGKHSEAIRRIEGGAERFPKADWSELRRRAVMEQARGLQQAGHFEEAITGVQSTLARFGPDEALERLKEELETNIEAARKRDAVAAAAHQARRLLDTGDLDTARHLLDSALQTHSDDRVLTDLRTETLDRIQTREMDRKRRELDGRLAKIETAIALHDWDQAARLLESVEADFPRSARAAELAAKLEDDKRHQRVVQRRAEIDALIQFEDWGRAQKELAAFEQEFPSDESLPGLTQRIQTGARASRLRAQSSAVRTAVENKDWTKAAAALESLCRDFPHDTVTRDLTRLYEEEWSLDQVVMRSRELISSGDLYAARAEIARGLSLRKDPLLESLGSQVENGIRTREIARPQVPPANPAPAPSPAFPPPPQQQQQPQQQLPQRASTASGTNPKLHQAAPYQPPFESRPGTGSSVSPTRIGIGVAAAAVLAVAGYFALRADPPVIVTPPALSVRVGEPFEYQLVVKGGKAPYRWSITQGELPSGIEIAAESGKLSGSPSAATQSSFRATVTDQGGASHTATVAISVEAPPSRIAPVERPRIQETPRKEPARKKETTTKAKQPDPVRVEPIKPEPVKPEPVKTEIPKVDVPTGEAEVARRGTQVWNGSLEPGGVVTISGTAPSIGRLSGLAVPGNTRVEVVVQSPAGVTVIQQPGADSNFRTFAIRNNSPNTVTRIQFQWQRR